MRKQVFDENFEKIEHLINKLVLWLEYITYFQPIVREMDDFGTPETIIEKYSIYECMVEERIHQIEELTNGRVSVPEAIISMVQTGYDILIPQIFFGIHAFFCDWLILYLKHTTSPVR